MEGCSEDLQGNDMDLRDVLQRFESHGWRSWRVPSRRGWRFVKASGLSVRAITQDSSSHTLFDCYTDDMQ